MRMRESLINENRNEKYGKDMNEVGELMISE